jgi:hypothetical protein
MGFQLRASVSVSPLRFDRAKFWNGVSAGITGFRGGGNCVHMGLSGLYFIVLVACAQWQPPLEAQGQLSLPRLEVGTDVDVTSPGLKRNFREQHLVVNPSNSDHLIVAAMRETARDQFVTDVLVSLDAGTTWKNARPAVEMQRGDPWLAVGRANAAYCVTLVVSYFR